MITLAEAVKSGRLDEFAAQEEARGIGPAPSHDLDAALSRLITAGKSAGRTSRCSSSDGSTGKKTR
jgi:hypothetical protein